jgi:transcription termination factor Rho
VIDEVRAIALRGGDAVILIDTLEGLHEHAARRALATARKLVDGGSVTLIATASEPLGGETTVVALDPELAGAGRFPAIDPRSSGTLRAELLVGEEGAQSIARARAGDPEPATPRRRRSR